MQDIRAIGGGAAGGSGGGGRFFAAGDRRTRPNNHLQAVNCPRCDSVNTKFCYYNNYNLSQPRHFCKSCRRYWTKGGVLRNVPVGGGCRKTKRVKQKSGVAPNSGEEAARERAAKAQSSSSTDNSGLCGAATAEEGSAGGNTAPISAGVYNYSGGSFFPENPSFDNRTALVSQPTDGQIFPSEIGGFGGLMASTASAEMMEFGLAHIPMTPYRLQQGFSAPAAEISRPVAEFKLPELKGGMSDEGIGAVAAEPDWGSSGGVEQGLFDLTATVDPAYWSQPHWTDNDLSSLNYLP